ncbi:MAG: VWA domain-containing protein [Phycisphaerales bacterium]|nr:VWA domain-containing protein [Phycisphaerales bacterium]
MPPSSQRRKHNRGLRITAVGRNPKSRARRGSIMVQTTVFGSAVGLGVAALAVDTGLMYGAKQELQSAADAAALAAASQLGTTANPTDMALAEAAKYASQNSIMGDNADLIQTDLVFGHATMSGDDKFDFHANTQPYDAVKVTLRRDQSASDGPVSLLFARTFGLTETQMEASAVAMLVPRDIALVIDLSGSMNDDSELRHYDTFASEKSGTIDGVQINLKDIWLALPVNKGCAGIKNGSNPSSPGAPAAGDSQPATGAGSPQVEGGNPDPGDEPAGGSSNPTGPRWGWMTGFGDPVTLNVYNPTNDDGLYYIPRYYTCTDPDVIANLTEAGYTSSERSALLSSQYDYQSTYYRNRVKVLLGLAGWKSGKSGAKFSSGGNGNSIVGSSELTQEVSYPFADGSWSDYVDYVKSSSTWMEDTDSDLRYRYGIKTFVNYLLEDRANHGDTPELADAPEEPLYSVKDAVQTMINEIVTLDTQDHVSLETFGQYGIHRMDLSIPDSGQTLAEALQLIPTNLNTYQAGHDTSTTNIGAGMNKAIAELTSSRARTAASKVIIMLTDGKPNVNEYNSYVGNNHADAIDWAIDQAAEAKNMGMTVYSIGVGGDVNEDLCIDMASTAEHYYFADNAPDPDNNNEPYYVNQLKQIFQTLGGKRPVRLIQ